MKSTRFFAASLAAVTLFSCSKELTQAPEDVLNPGDARVEVNIGKTVTTYASQADELLIKNSMYALYKSDSTGMITTHPVEGTPVDKINFTVSGTDVTNNPKALLVVVANTTNFTSNGTAAIAMPATFKEAEAMAIQGAISDADGVLANGIPASKVYKVNLTSGGTVTLTEKLQRAASRIFVKANGGNAYADITGYTIAYKSAVSTNLVTRQVAPAAAQTPDAIAYTVKADALAGSYNGTQAVGYVYPSTTAQGSFTVTNTTGIARTIAFAAEANKNYAVNIVTAEALDGTVTFDLAVDAWDATDGSNTNVDFGINFRRRNPVGAGVDKLYTAATIANDTSATVVVRPGQIAKIPISIPAGYTLERFGADNGLSVVDGNKAYVNPSAGVGVWKARMDVKKEGILLASIYFTRDAVAAVDFENINIFESFIGTGLLADVDITSANNATLTVPLNTRSTYRFAIPSGYTFVLKSASGTTAGLLPTVDWALIQNGFPHIENRFIHDDVEAVYAIHNASNNPIATFTMKRAAQPLTFSAQGPFGDPLHAGIGSQPASPLFMYAAKTDNTAEVTVLTDRIFDAVGIGYMQLEKSNNFTTEVSVSKGPNGWLLHKIVAQTGIGYHRIDIAAAATPELCVGKFTYKSKLKGTELGHTTVTRRPGLN